MEEISLFKIPAFKNHPLHFGENYNPSISDSIKTAIGLFRLKLCTLRGLLLPKNLNPSLQRCLLNIQQQMSVLQLAENEIRAKFRIG